ncbi:MAG: isoprenylcysteine carboxylmethyltransferase family protein [Acidobacteriaceae bacterium]|nr:isoprenylcysteine carboxylmethyltransferase family protein [Acidobacteriaceae bacterium]
MLIASLLMIRTAWIVTAVVWLFGMVSAKPRARAGSAEVRLTYLVLAIIGGFCIGDKRLHWGWLGQRFAPPSISILFLGAVLTVIGCAVAIWARTVLGSNWSGVPDVKQGHTLVQTGPYALTRHPIYTGFLIAVFGTALAVFRYRALIGFVLVLVSILLKIQEEEKLMSESFPNEYASYRNRVKALVPWVL